MPHAPQTNTFNLASAKLDYSPEDVATFIELVRHRSREAVETFIAQKGKAIVHVRDAQGMTPVMHATHTGHAATIEVLLKHGADIDAPDNNGMTALMAASLRGFTKMVGVLLAFEANIEAQDNHGLTPLMHAAYHEATPNARPRLSDRKKDTIALLLKSGASLEATDKKNNTAEIRAERNRNLDALQILTDERSRRAEVKAAQDKELADTIGQMREGTAAAITAPRTASFRRNTP